MICRVAESVDWSSLSSFFNDIYRQNHPLQKYEFWDWQFGNEKYGRSLIVDNGGKVAGHVGAAFGGGYAWIINVYLNEDCRGKGLLRELYQIAREYAPIAAANINAAGLNLYRNMGYIRYCNLQRFVAINPDLSDEPLNSINPVCDYPEPEGHFFKQPGIEGIVLPDGSTAIKQFEVGGLRIVNLGNPKKLLDICKEMGIRWIDFMTSWNDPICRLLESEQWINGDPIPWNLNPIELGSKSEMAFVSEKPMPNDFIVKGTYSDIRRVGSL